MKSNRRELNEKMLDLKAYHLKKCNSGATVSQEQQGVFNQFSHSLETIAAGKTNALKKIELCEFQIKRSMQCYYEASDKRQYAYNLLRHRSDIDPELRRLLQVCQSIHLACLVYMISYRRVCIEFMGKIKRYCLGGELDDDIFYERYRDYSTRKDKLVTGFIGLFNVENDIGDEIRSRISNLEEQCGTESLVVRLNDYMNYEQLNLCDDNFETLCSNMNSYISDLKIYVLQENAIIDQQKSVKIATDSPTSVVDTRSAEPMRIQRVSKCVML